MCWDFSEKEIPPIPIIPISVISKSQTKLLLNFKIDSGYAGALGLTPKVIKDLKLEKLGLTPINTPTGQKNVPYYLIHIKNEEWDLKLSKTYALETPRLLAGRSLFKGKKLLLDFEENQACILLKD